MFMQCQIDVEILSWISAVFNALQRISESTRRVITLFRLQRESRYPNLLLDTLTSFLRRQVIQNWMQKLQWIKNTYNSGILSQPTLLTVMSVAFLLQKQSKDRFGLEGDEESTMLEESVSPKKWVVLMYYLLQENVDHSDSANTV